MTLVKHLMSTVSFVQKYENAIYVFTGQLFVSVLPKNII